MSQKPLELLAKCFAANSLDPMLANIAPERQRAVVAVIFAQSCHTFVGDADSMTIQLDDDISLLVEFDDDGSVKHHLFRVPVQASDETVSIQT